MFGVLAIDKPSGWTSRDVVNRIQKWCRPHKVGHTGTLDPLATGVLLIAIGRATRLVEFSHRSVKSYVGDFQLGKASDTLDIEGEVRSLASSPRITNEKILKVLPQWTGSIDQIPPKYSAVQIDGRRAYELARAGKEFDVPRRRVHIHSLELVDFDDSHQCMKIEVHCSSGTYIRTLGSDIAQSLGSDAVMSALKRTSIGTVRITDCRTLEEIQSQDDLQRSLISPLCLVESLPRCTLTDEGSKKIRNGIPIYDQDFLSAPQMENTLPDCASAEANNWVALDQSGELAAILHRQRDAYRSLRVFHSESETTHPNKTSTKQIPES